MDNERDSSSFCFRFANFYLQLRRIRIDEDVEEGTHLYTVQQRISKSQQDARDARSIEAMPSGLEGPSLGLLFKLFYLQLLRFRDHKFLQSINEPLSVNAPTVQRSGSGRPVTASLQEEDAYLTIDRSEILGRHTVEQLARGDTIPMLDIVQRHHDVPFCSGDTTDERDVLDILERSGVTYIVQNALLWRGAKDPSVYFRGYVEGTRAVIEAAIAAGVCKLVYTSSTGVVFDSTDVVNVDERAPYLEKPFDAYNLLPYRSTMSSEPRLDPEGAMAKLNESLHHALPPICATTEYHRTMQTLSSYVTPPPNAESILSAYNTPFDPREPTGFVVRSRADEQVSFITNGEPIYILEVTELFDEKTRYMRRSTSAVQVARIQEWEVAYEKGQQTVGVERRSAAQRCYYEWGEWVHIEGKEMFDDEGREVARRILATTTGLDVDRQLRKIGSIIRGRQSMMGADPELDSSSFRFDFEMLYLCLRYSRGNRYLRQMAIAIRGSTISFEQSTHRSKTYNEIDAWPLLSEGEDEGASLSRREGYATTSAEDNCAYKYEGFGLTYDG
ncbi:hypothetical protein BKA82DRAFT_22199 [Pisolithus tinctorius]|nr:hypothetical protein BKA82DRAFT_22199 [Pisolithus tinctorius]